MHSTMHFNLYLAEKTFLPAGKLIETFENPCVYTEQRIPKQHDVYFWHWSSCHLLDVATN